MTTWGWEAGGLERLLLLAKPILQEYAPSLQEFLTVEMRAACHASSSARDTDNLRYVNQVDLPTISIVC